MAQLMPLPLSVSCFTKIQIGLPFWCRLTRVVRDKGSLNVCVCVCVYCVVVVGGVVTVSLERWLARRRVHASVKRIARPLQRCADGGRVRLRTQIRKKS